MPREETFKRAITIINLLHDCVGIGKINNQDTKDSIAAALLKMKDTYKYCGHNMHGNRSHWFPSGGGWVDIPIKHITVEDLKKIYLDPKGFIKIKTGIFFSQEINGEYGLYFANKKKKKKK